MKFPPWAVNASRTDVDSNSSDVHPNVFRPEPAGRSSGLNVRWYSWESYAVVGVVSLVERPIADAGGSRVVLPGGLPAPVGGGWNIRFDVHPRLVVVVVMP
jgi:hypothetical protein